MHQHQRLCCKCAAQRIECGPVPLYGIGIKKIPMHHRPAPVIQKVYGSVFPLDYTLGHIIVPFPDKLLVRQAVLEGQVRKFRALHKFVLDIVLSAEHLSLDVGLKAQSRHLHESSGNDAVDFHEKVESGIRGPPPADLAVRIIAPACAENRHTSSYSSRRFFSPPGLSLPCILLTSSHHLCRIWCSMSRMESWSQCR